MYIDDKKAYIFSPYGLGDTMILCGLKREIEKKYKCNIVFLIKKTHEFVMNIYSILDYQIVEFNEKNIDERLCSKTLKMGKIFVAHPEYTGEKDVLEGFINKKYSFLLMYKLFWGLNKTSVFEKPNNYPKIKQKYNDIAFIAPEMNASDKKDLVPIDYFKKRICQLKKEGYRIIVNATKKEVISEFEGYVQEMSLGEAVEISLSADIVISSRSGFSDIIAFQHDNLEVIYPNKHFWYMYNFSRTYGLENIMEIVL